MSQFLLGVTSFKSGDYPKAEEHFNAASENPIGELTSAIALGWTRLAAGDADGALKAVDLPKQPDWAQFYLRYHRALIADLAGRKADARASYEKCSSRTAARCGHHSPMPSSGPLRRFQNSRVRSSRNSSPRRRAIRIRSPKICSTRINRKEKTPLLISNRRRMAWRKCSTDWVKRSTGEGGVSLGTIYLQLALYAKPDHAFALAALANAQEAAKRYDDAIATYDKIPQGTPLQSAIDIRKAFDLNSLEKTDEAKAILVKLVEKDPEGRPPA